MITVETKHSLNDSYATGVEKTVKVWKLFGVVIKRKIYHYPKVERFEVVKIY